MICLNTSLVLFWIEIVTNLDSFEINIPIPDAFFIVAAVSIERSSSDETITVDNR